MDRSARRETIAASALALFNARGIGATNVKDICADANASVGSFYHWFGSKEGLVAALVTDALHLNLQALERQLATAKTARATVAAVVNSLIDWALAHPDQATHVYAATVGPGSSELRDELAELSRQTWAVFEQAFSPHWTSGAIKKLPGPAFTSILLGPSHDFLRRWLGSQVASSPADHRNLFVAAAWAALKGDSNA
jgi:AcrR family transcriptional regulator